MAVGAWTFYNKAKANLGNGKLNLSGGHYRVTLHGSGSNASTLTLSTIASVTTEVSEANGYSSSGKPLTTTWLSGASAGQRRFSFSPALVWTGTGGTISNIRYAVIWCSGASATVRKLVCFSQLSTGKFDLTINNTLTLTASATGVFNLA